MMSANVVIFSESASLRNVLSQHNVLPGVSFDWHKDISEYKATDDIVILDADYLPDYGDFLENRRFICLSGQEPLSKYHFQKPYRLINLLGLLEEMTGDMKVVNSISIGLFKFNHTQKTLTSGSQKIGLTEKEAEIISVLAAIAPNSIDKKELLNRVWGYDETIDTNTLETHMYRLRKKVGDDGFILTDKDGYKLKAV